MKENILIAALIAALGVAIAVVAKLGALIPWLIAISLGAAFCKGLEIFCDWHDERQARKPSGKQAALTADHVFARPADIVLSFDRHGRRGVSFRDASGTDDFPAVLVTVDALPRNRRQSPPEVAVKLSFQCADLGLLLQQHDDKFHTREHEQGRKNSDETPAKQPKDGTDGIDPREQRDQRTQDRHAPSDQGIEQTRLY